MTEKIPKPDDRIPGEPYPTHLDEMIDSAQSVMNLRHAESELRLLLALVGASTQPHSIDPVKRLLDIGEATGDIYEQAPHLIDAARKAGEGTR